VAEEAIPGSKDAQGRGIFRKNTIFNVQRGYCRHDFHVISKTPESRRNRAKVPFHVVIESLP